MNYDSKDGQYRLLKNRSGFHVERLGQKMVTVTKSVGKGVIVQYVKPVADVIPGYSSTVLDVRNWDGSGWSVDHEAGALRWSGWKSNRAVWNALYRLGFSREQIQDVTRHARTKE